MNFADPERNIKQFQLKEGSIVADFGSGSGFYSLAAGRAVGSNGRIYALDVHKEMLERLKAEAKRENLKNIEVIWTDLEKKNGSKIADSTVDAGIISNILFQIGDKKAFASEVARVIKKGGKILVIDWTDSFSGMGPRADHIFTENDAEKLFKDLGFEKERTIETGEHHYGIIMKYV